MTQASIFITIVFCEIPFPGRTKLSRGPQAAGWDPWTTWYDCHTEFSRRTIPGIPLSSICNLICPILYTKTPRRHEVLTANHHLTRTVFYIPSTSSLKRKLITKYLVILFRIQWRPVLMCYCATAHSNFAELYFIKIVQCKLLIVPKILRIVVSDHASLQTVITTACTNYS